MSSHSTRPTLVIAGASGFVGKWFIDKFHTQFKIIALSRKEVKSQIRPNVEWKTVDLFSLSETSHAMNGADYALYLIHSMSPTTRLNQGSFEDTDLLLADNFYKAAIENRIKHLIYLGGIIPSGVGQLSRHLQSRLEVEETFAQGKITFTSLRASIVIGPGGSSFEMMTGLVKRLPIMLCPAWTASECQPIDIRDLLEILKIVIGNENYYDQVFDVGGEEVVSYKLLLKRTSQSMQKRRIFLSVPIKSVNFSKWWVARFSSTSFSLVSPLVESLIHDMMMTKPIKIEGFKPHRLSESFDYALTSPAPNIPASTPLPSEKNTVRSVQRIKNISQLSAYSIGVRYLKWLEKISLGLISVKNITDKFEIMFFGITLLELTLISEKSSDDRLVYFVTGGKLVKRTEHGWLEFRSVLGNRYVMVALHEFVPRLTWPFYRSTQAVLHLWVTKWFGNSLR